MSSAVEQALAAAKDAAAATNVPAIVSNSNLPAAPVAVAQRLSLDDAMNQTGMAVEDFLKFDKTGFLIGKQTVVFEQLKVGIDKAAIRAVYSVRWGDNPVKYAKSEDKVHTVGSPMSWQQTLEIAARDPKPGSEYVTYEIPFVVLEEVKDLKGNVAAEAGKVIGHTPSVTNAKDFSALLRKMSEKGIERAEVLMKHRAKSKGNNVWGAADYEIIGEWIDGDE